jgi:hypothetical protein
LSGSIALFGVNQPELMRFFEIPGIMSLKGLFKVAGDGKGCQQHEGEEKQNDSDFLHNLPFENPSRDLSLTKDNIIQPASKEGDPTARPDC